MDDITRKRLEQERAEIPRVAGDFVSAAHAAVEGKSFETHDQVMESMGFPKDAMPRFATMMMGISVGAITRHHGTLKHCLKLFDIVSGIREIDAYDICCDDEVGDQLEAFTDELDKLNPPCTCGAPDCEAPAVSFAEVVEWARMLRNAIAEMTMSLEMHLDIKEKPLHEVRRIARAASRFWVEICHSMVQQQFPPTAS